MGGVLGILGGVERAPFKFGRGWEGPQKVWERLGVVWMAPEVRKGLEGHSKNPGVYWRAPRKYGRGWEGPQEVWERLGVVWNAPEVRKRSEGHFENPGGDWRAPRKYGRGWEGPQKSGRGWMG